MSSCTERTDAAAPSPTPPIRPDTRHLVTPQQGAAPAGLEDVMSADSVDPPQRSAPHVLILTRTEGFRHGSIERGRVALHSLAESRGLRVTLDDETTPLTADWLSLFDAVVFLSVTGDALSDDEQAAFEAWFRQGKGFVGIHAAADCEYGWPWYGGLVGAWFERHPAPQHASLTVVDPRHPATLHLGSTWQRFDEWYDFRSQPASTVRVLLRLDEDSYDGGLMGAQHPIAWAHEYDGGRAFYTGGGHTEASYTEVDFLAHIAGGLLWALGR